MIKREKFRALMLVILAAALVVVLGVPRVTAIPEYWQGVITIVCYIVMALTAPAAAISRYLQKRDEKGG